VIFLAEIRVLVSRNGYAENNVDVVVREKGSYGTYSRGYTQGGAATLNAPNNKAYIVELSRYSHNNTCQICAHTGRRECSFDITTDQIR
jgi:hypothetical protein